MDIKALRDTLEELKKDLGPGLLNIDVYSRADGQSLAGFNSNPKACALFNKVTGDIESALKGAKFPDLGRYYMLDLVDEKLVVIVPVAEYQWNMLLDKTQIQLGLVLNIVLPKVMVKADEAPVKKKSEPEVKAKGKSEPDMMPEELSDDDKQKPAEADTTESRCTIDFS